MNDLRGNGRNLGLGMHVVTISSLIPLLSSRQTDSFISMPTSHWSAHTLSRLGPPHLPTVSIRLLSDSWCSKGKVSPVGSSITEYCW